MPARQGGVDGTLKRFPACRALPLRQLAEFSQRPLDRPNLARSREKVLHGVVDFRHVWVIAPASEKGRESKQRDGGGEFRLLAAEISGCSDQRRWVCALRGGTLDSDVEKPGTFSRPQTICPCRRGFRSDPGEFGGGPGPGMCEPESGRPKGSSCRWPHAGHNADRPHPRDRGRSIASHKTGRWTFRRNRDCALRAASANPIAPSHNP